MSTQKKKLIRVEGRPGSMDDYFSPGNFLFSFAASPDHVTEEGARRQACASQTCRESLNRLVMRAYQNIDDSARKPDIDAPIDFDRLRLIVAVDADVVEELKVRLFSGKAALNVLEDVAGWKRSVITTVKHSVYDNAWLLTGPSEWMSQPQLLSLATWILRLAARYGPLTATNIDELEAEIKNISKRHRIRSGGDNDKQKFAPLFWNKLRLIMEHHEEIFKGMTLDKAWSDSKESGRFGSRSGLFTFVNFHSENFPEYGPEYSDDVLECQKRFLELCKTHNVDARR